MMQSHSYKLQNRQSNQAQIYKNVMEWLVTEEVEQQLQKVSPKLLRYINKIEVATFALNRLPPLYASSEEGLQRQEKRAKREYRQEITKAVRQAIAAVQRDPIRFSTPLVSKENLESQQAKAALEELQDVLQKRELSWKNIAKVVHQAITQKTSEKKSILQRDVPKIETSPAYDWGEEHYLR